MHSVHMAEPRCEYCSMISLFTFDASKVSCVIFSQKHKSFHHHCDHVLLVLLWICIFHFLHQMFGHRHARQICTSTSTTISNHITEHSRTPTHVLDAKMAPPFLWSPRFRYEFIFCRYGPMLIRICYDSQNASKRQEERGSKSFLSSCKSWTCSTIKAANYIT